MVSPLDDAINSVASLNAEYNEALRAYKEAVESADAALRTHRQLDDIARQRFRDVEDARKALSAGEVALKQAAVEHAREQGKAR